MYATYIKLYDMIMIMSTILIMIMISLLVVICCDYNYKHDNDYDYDMIMTMSFDTDFDYDFVHDCDMILFQSCCMTDIHVSFHYFCPSPFPEVPSWSHSSFFLGDPPGQWKPRLRFARGSSSMRAT